MNWSELIKQQVPEIDERTCFHTARLAQVLETYELFDLGVTLHCSPVFVTFTLSPHNFIHVYCTFRHPDLPYHFSYNNHAIYNQTLNGILELINTNWSNLFNVKEP